MLVTRVGGLCGRCVWKRVTPAAWAALELQPRGHSTDAPRPKGHWLSAENRREFLDQVAREFGVEQVEDWKKVTQRQVIAKGGSGLVSRYKGSLLAALRDTYPKQRFDPVICRPQVPPGYWDSLQNRRAFMESVQTRLGITSMEQWKRVTNKQLLALGGGRLLNIYAGSIYAALEDLFPEMEVGPACRGRTPKAYWDSKERRQELLLALAERCGVHETADWLRVTFDDFAAMGGRRLVGQRSVLSLVEEGVQLTRQRSAGHVSRRQLARERRAFLFRPSLPASFWQEKENVAAFVEHAAGELGLREAHDWYRVSVPQLLEVKGARSLLRAMPLLEALRIALPGERWEQSGLDSKLKKASQRHMLLSVQAIFTPLATGNVTC